MQTQRRLSVGCLLPCFFFLSAYVSPLLCLFFFFNDTATTEIYTLSLHDALPISRGAAGRQHVAIGHACERCLNVARPLYILIDAELTQDRAEIGRAHV